MRTNERMFRVNNNYTHHFARPKITVPEGRNELCIHNLFTMNDAEIVCDALELKVLGKESPVEDRERIVRDLRFACSLYNYYRILRAIALAIEGLRRKKYQHSPNYNVEMIWSRPSRVSLLEAIFENKADHLQDDVFIYRFSGNIYDELTYVLWSDYYANEGRRNDRMQPRPRERALIREIKTRFDYADSFMSEAIKNAIQVL